MTEQSRFDSVATQYAAARPNYPPELYDALALALGRPLRGTRIADVGAGTGIASRQLAERGAQVTAIELSGAMLAGLAASSPGVRPVRGSGNALPLRTDSVDLVTYAQAWHWVDPARAVPEFRRVLRPGGLFAVWWNDTARDTPWEIEQQERVMAANPRWRDFPNARDGDHLADDYGLIVEQHSYTRRRTITIETHLANMVSKSYIASLPNVDEFIDTERRILSPLFPDGLITERLSTALFVVRDPGKPVAAVPPRVG